MLHKSPNRLLLGIMSQQNEQLPVFKGQDEFSDQSTISITMDIAKRLVQHPKVTARQIVGLGHALHALECLPTITPGSGLSLVLASV